MTPIVIKNISATSPAAASTVASTATATGLDSFSSVEIVATLQGATGGTLDVYVQKLLDGVWYDYAHFAQRAAGAAAVTYTATPALTNSIATVGTGTSPALVAGTCAGGRPGTALRLLFVAGAGTSLGAVQTVKVAGYR